MSNNNPIIKASEARSRGAKIGDGTLIFGILDLDKPELITIGSGCLIASQAYLLCHGYSSEWNSIMIGDNCYIGWNALILPGSVIGNNCVVGARTVVTKAHSIPDWSLVVGNPPRIVRKLNENSKDLKRHQKFIEHMKQFKGK